MGQGGRASDHAAFLTVLANIVKILSKDCSPLGSEMDRTLTILSHWLGPVLEEEDG